MKTTVPVSARKDIIRVDFDRQLDASDFYNLKTLKLPKPSEVLNLNTMAETLYHINKIRNREIVQKWERVHRLRNSQLQKNQRFITERYIEKNTVTF